ncbi:MAG: DUF4296 domain-containing protein [Bacteroidota bacterium]|nr:DUF4296 domain-containing protein [Bacteroidota bacterium]MDP4218463.1 DUF4296 domain-containing protein [Bacteroidota bacterium]MDP4247734.1 DUF4296 domain-containing protein [Bacteroidota bacterium]MDP4252738.1 DUF4296 domain-containing protein [Bacteroidota bacterium]MDP4256810.1 DUF4296 domain-containing protein [Bacteroidota bacterium]
MRTAACLLVLSFLLGCSNKDKVPSGIIPRDRMSGILWDMVQADQYTDTYLVKDSAHINVKTATMQLYLKVFQLHKISLEEFRKSMRYYLDHPDMTRSLFDSVINRGNRQRAESFKTIPALPSHGQGAVIPPPVPGHPSATPARGSGMPGTHLPFVTKPGLVSDSVHASSHKSRPKTGPSVKWQ